MAISSWKRSFQIRQLFIQKTKVKHILIGFQLTIFVLGDRVSGKKPTNYFTVCQHLIHQCPPKSGLREGGTSEKTKVQCFMSCRSFFSPVLFYLCIFYWQIIALQCCGDLCDTSMQISHNHIYICMYIPSLLSLPSLPMLQYYFMK